MRITDTSDLWWKSAVIYCLDVETFLDANQDGVGDLDGLARRIDYLAQLGITCLWLMPFYPSPDRDDGYDVTDYLNVDPRLGDLGQLVEVVQLAHDRGIRVIVDLVINHTSDQHPWFKASRKEKDRDKNPFRDYYVWRAEDPGDTSDQVVFPDVEDSIWELDEKTGEYYLHHFYKHQPDLNLDHPPVVDELMSAVGFWMQLGLDGFRVDGVPFFGQLGDVEGRDDIVDAHRFVRQLRDFVSRRNGSAVMVGEVNLPYDKQLDYFGGDAGDELHVQFDFVAMQATYLSLARADARPLVDALTSRPELPRACQWATFLRNHDEATLDQLTEEERQEVFAAFGPEPQMQIYGRGLKRRLPPMLQGEPRRLRMAYSLLMSLPGTPTLYYGEEIGMGEDLERDGRMAVRTPMQWTSGPDAGFSQAKTSQLISRTIPGAYGPEHVNVLDQLHDEDSLLSWIRTLIHIRHSCQELGWGDLTVLEHDAGEAVLAHRVDHGGAGVLTLHNLGAEPVSVAVPLDDADDGSYVVDLLTHETVECPGGRLEVALEGYGVRWVRIRPAHDLGLP